MNIIADGVYPKEMTIAIPPGPVQVKDGEPYFRVKMTNSDGTEINTWIFVINGKSHEIHFSPWLPTELFYGRSKGETFPVTFNTIIFNKKYTFDLIVTLADDQMRCINRDKIDFMRHEYNTTKVKDGCFTMTHYSQNDNVLFIIDLDMVPIMLYGPRIYRDLSVATVENLFKKTFSLEKCNAEWVSPERFVGCDDIENIIASYERPCISAIVSADSLMIPRYNEYTGSVFNAGYDLSYFSKVGSEQATSGKYDAIPIYAKNTNPPPRVCDIKYAVRFANKDFIYYAIPSPGKYWKTF